MHDSRCALAMAPCGCCHGGCWGTSRTWTSRSRCWTRRARDTSPLGAWVECGGSRTRPPRERACNHIPPLCYTVSPGGLSSRSHSFRKVMHTSFVRLWAPPSSLRLPARLPTAQVARTPQASRPLSRHGPASASGGCFREGSSRWMYRLWTASPPRVFGLRRSDRTHAGGFSDLNTGCFRL